jgi:hypothetical protein
MAMFEIYPWARFLAGMLTGCWIGAAIATAGVILLMGRRVRQLESINGGGGGHMLVMPLPDTHRQSEKPANRVARMN